MTAVARQSAYEILLEIANRGKYSNVALQQHYRRRTLADRDRALCTEIVYGTLQYQRSIDSLLEPLCTRGVRSVDERVLLILRMAIYQLGFLTRVPEYAVLSDAVDLCKQHAKKAAGFVNGVLRSFTRDKRSVAQKLAELTASMNPITRAGVRLSYPDWFVEELFEQYGEERSLAILESGNKPAVVSVRVNRTKMTPEMFVAAESAASDRSLEVSEVSPVGVRLMQGLDIEHWGAYENGLVTIQDEASMLVVPLLHADGDTKVLDLCAGLGTKTTQILEFQNGTGNVTSVDIHQHKLERLKAAAERLGLSGVKTLVTDARSFRSSARYRDSFDAVLLDAPCSGMGVLRRRPEIRWRRTRQESVELSHLQVELLEAAVNVVRPGGVIVYATCTILERENQQVLQAVLDRSKGKLVCEDITPDLPPAIRERYLQTIKLGAEGAQVLPGNNLGITVTPEWFYTDGFFMARLRKQA